MDSSNWKAKAEEFLRSHLGDDNSDAEEAAVYFLSRRQKDTQISDTISNSLERWRNDKTQWAQKSLSFGPARAASVLRLMQWGEIGALKKYQDSICDNLDVPNSNDYYGSLHSNTSAFYPFVFPLFTSDIAINRMNSKLTFLMHLWQNHLNDLFMKKEIFGNSIEEGRQYNQTHATLISAYIFAACRLNYAGINQEIFKKAVQYLLDNQNDSGLWGYDHTNSDSEEVDVPSFAKYVNSRKHVVLTAMGIHALSLAQHFGTHRCIENAANWLLQHQHDDGGWYQHDNPKYKHPIYTTVLVLDALELAHGGTQVTFSLPENKKEDLPIQNGQNNVIIRSSGPIYLQKSNEDNENIPLKDLTLEGVKDSIKLAEHELLQDKINNAICKEYFIFENEKEKNPNLKIFSIEKLTETLKKDNKIPENFSSEMIRQRVHKLIKAGIIIDYFAEKRKISREKAADKEYIKRKTQT